VPQDADATAAQPEVAQDSPDEQLAELETQLAEPEAVELGLGTQPAEVPAAADTQIVEDAPPTPRAARPTPPAAAKAAPTTYTLAAAFARSQSLLQSSPTGLVDVAVINDVVAETVDDGPQNRPVADSVADGNGKCKGKRKRAGSNAKGNGKRAKAMANDAEGKGNGSDVGADHDGSEPTSPSIDIESDDAPISSLAKGKGKRSLDGESKGDGKGTKRHKGDRNESGWAVPGVDAAIVQTEIQPWTPWTPSSVFASHQLVPAPPQSPAEGFERGAICEPCGSGDMEVAFCNWCKSPVHMSKMRVTGKKSTRYKCNRCNSTIVKLTKALGSWPSNEFLKLDDDERAQFYNDAGAMSSTERICNLFESRIEKFKVRKDAWAYGGEYRPLGYWANLGYDTQRLAANSRDEDIIETDQAGTCYRLRVLSAGAQGESGTLQSVNYGASNRPQAPLAIANEHPPTPPAPTPATESKAEFAARMKAERDARKASEREASTKRTAAAHLLKKISGPLSQLAAALNMPTIKELSPSLTKNSFGVLDNANAEVAKIKSLSDHYDPNETHTKEVRVAWKAHLHEGWDATP